MTATLDTLITDVSQCARASGLFRDGRYGPCWNLVKKGENV